MKHPMGLVDLVLLYRSRGTCRMHREGSAGDLLSFLAMPGIQFVDHTLIANCS
jgi:hypothetical protein